MYVIWGRNRRPVINVNVLSSSIPNSGQYPNAGFIQNLIPQVQTITFTDQYHISIDKKTAAIIKIYNTIYDVDDTTSDEDRLKEYFLTLVGPFDDNAAFAIYFINSMPITEQSVITTFDINYKDQIMQPSITENTAINIQYDLKTDQWIKI